MSKEQARIKEIGQYINEAVRIRREATFNWVHFISLLHAISEALSYEPGFVFEIISSINVEAKDYEKIFFDAKTDYERERSIKRQSQVAIFFPFYIHLQADEIITQTILGANLTLSRWSEAEKDKLRPKIETEVTDKLGEEYLFPGSVCKFRMGYCDHTDVIKYKRILECLQGVAEFSRSVKKIPQYNNAKAINSVCHPGWIYIDADQETKNFYVFDVKSLNQECPDFNGTFKDNFLYILELVNKAHPGNFYDLILDCIRLYYFCQEKTYAQDALLAYWQVLERLAMQEDARGETAQVISNTAKVIPKVFDELPQCKLALNRIARLRNKFVHSGNHEFISWDDVHVIKFIVDEALLALVRNRDLFESQSEYYLFIKYSALDARLTKETAKVIDIISEHKFK